MDLALFGADNEEIILVLVKVETCGRNLRCRREKTVETRTDGVSDEGHSPSVVNGSASSDSVAGTSSFSCTTSLYIISL